MAKFIFKMESILSVKEKLEEQAKAEYSIEMMKLRQEEEKLDKLKLRRDMYQSKLYDAVTDKLNILEIKILEDSVENIKYNIKLQMVVVANQQRAVEKAGEKLDNAMKERKTYEKLKENAFEEFKAEINAEEQKAIELCQKILMKVRNKRMAKKDKDKIVGEENESGGSKLVTALIAIVIILIWLAVFAFLIKMDVGGIGSKVLYPVLKDVPVVNKILPNVSEDVQAEEGDYEYTTLKAANERIKELESKLKSENGTQDANSDYISELEAKLMKLQKYKDEYDDFQKRVKEFDEKVVFTKNAPDISEYQKYYEEIQPENAEKIYKQVLLKLQYTKKAEELGKFYANMDADKAAARLSEMSEDLSLIRDILENMTEKQAAAILQEMDVDFAAQVTKKISSVKK